MKEFPILMNGEMVRATLAGRKTNTRRIICPKNPPPTDQKFLYDRADGFGRVAREHNGVPVVTEFYDNMRCPFGDVGDRLWVRESWNCGGFYLRDNQRFTAANIPKSAPNIPTWVEYAATVKDGEHPPTWRPSIHMPRWASRITLEITGVKVERLQDISEEDAKAEGAEFITYGCCGTLSGYKPADPNAHAASYVLATDWFKGLWYSINGKGAWDLNPWVWAIAFKQHPTNALNYKPSSGGEQGDGG